MNTRFFIADKDGMPPVWWFGGGYDLTPYYGFDEDCIHWHQTIKNGCMPFGEQIYPKLKRWCDEYFYVTHRQEPRGIGGFFFDDLNEWPFETCFQFMKMTGDTFLPAYLPIVTKRQSLAWTSQHRQWQELRRGRYVEFNLVQDRGTIFGLQSGGRTESILMSLPPHVQWQYNHAPEPNSEEAKLLEYYLTGKDWVALTP